MMGAAKISCRMGLISEDIITRQEKLLRKFGLPATCSAVELSAVLQAMQLDKKVTDKKVRWVLLSGIGSATIRSDVPDDTVGAAIGELKCHSDAKRQSR